MAKKSREHQQDALIEDDIKYIHDALESGDKELLWNMLEGEGFTPYKQQTDKEIDTEYNERGMRDYGQSSDKPMKTKRKGVKLM